ncbi:adenosylcobinamide-phosphate synthase CbiB [Pseudodesulfovibrio sediminis]|uniref:Cobalamin biosynthesis protein CobD n=1 Tax=Pseudodesulfovibrio sediminis TaxID=2810563 RepID=A0ABM7P382_9BACT|nr:adenosylcobinamide-phosphate synthase CbiB [Pseudodesulfovibrio sediminis]BCS87219.1 cobalamin biosynthesis protein CobD [Pseudodesulfovibrio sediminis]
MEIYYAFIIPVLAIVIDRVFGDPHSLPHPVRLIGKGLDMFEKAARDIDINLRPTGWGAIFLFSGLAWVVTKSLASIPYVGVIIVLYLAYAGLALGSLLNESNKVANLLDEGNLEEARQKLGLLVSRDTEALDENGLRRTLAETLSENFNDGFVAPLFYLLLCGVGGLWVYKTVSTMDSMWGYKTEKYKDLGEGAARVDDVLAYIPARITACLMILVGKIRGLNFKDAWSNFVFDARKMESPNAGWPMAAAAWLVGAQMGGSTVYFGKIKEKPILGLKGVEWSKEKVQLLLGLCRWTGFLTACILIPLLGLLRLVF